MNEEDIHADASASRLILGTPQPIDRSWIAVQRLGNVISTVIFAAVLCGIVLVVHWRDDVPEQFHTPTTVAAVALFLLRAVHGQIWPAIAWRRISYLVDHHGLRIDRGVVYWQTIHVARNRIQHTDVERGPISRRFGLARLLIHTAGTENATITLEGLDARTAEELRDYLIAGAADESV